MIKTDTTSITRNTDYEALTRYLPILHTSVCKEILSGMSSCQSGMNLDQIIIINPLHHIFKLAKFGIYYGTVFHVPCIQLLIYVTP